MEVGIMPRGIRKNKDTEVVADINTAEIVEVDGIRYRRRKMDKATRKRLLEEQRVAFLAFNATLENPIPEDGIEEFLSEHGNGLEDGEEYLEEVIDE